MEEILKLLEEDGRLTAHQLAAMTKNKIEDVEAYIEQCERENIILGYPAIVDWDKTDEAIVTALIELQIVPQRGEGFERIAERIYQYDEVESLYLMSGTFDFAVIITGKSLKEISSFVYERLAPIEGVSATATHFIMKKYKDKHRIFEKREEQEERLLFV